MSLRSLKFLSPHCPRHEHTQAAVHPQEGGVLTKYAAPRRSAGSGRSELAMVGVPASGTGSPPSPAPPHRTSSAPAARPAANYCATA